jgi:hypothetical protein
MDFGADIQDSLRAVRDELHDAVVFSDRLDGVDVIDRAPFLLTVDISSIVRWRKY